MIDAATAKMSVPEAVEILHESGWVFVRSWAFAENVVHQYEQTYGFHVPGFSTRQVDGGGFNVARMLW
jgi:hypothetical protein